MAGKGQQAAPLPLPPEVSIKAHVETKIPDKNTKMVLYCGGGFRSALAADNLQKMGYTSVISLDGGWRAYTQAGLPVER